MRKPTLLVLAAGMGSRYGGLKQLDGVGPGGETIMDYSVYDAIRAGFGKVIFVIRCNFRLEFEKRIKERYGSAIEFGFVEQELDNIPEGFIINPERTKPWGTGHAVLVAAEFIDTPFAVINADDYYGQKSFEVLGAFLKEQWDNTGEYCMVGFYTSNTLSESGSVSRGLCTVDSNGYLTNVVSMNMWGFTPDLFKEGMSLFENFLKENIDELKSEFYIPYVVNKILESGKARCKVLNTPDKWFGVTYKQDKEKVITKIGDLVKKGIYPSPLFNN